MSMGAVLNLLRAVVALAVLAPVCLYYAVTRADRRARMTPLDRAILDGEDRKDETIRLARLRRPARPGRTTPPALAAWDQARPTPSPSRPLPARAMEDSAIGA